MEIRFLKANCFSFIVLFILVIGLASCSKRVIRVEVDKTDKPASTPTKDYDSKSKTGIGKPYVIDGVEYTPEHKPQNYVQKGIASWYGEKFHGRKTANGEIYNMYAMTAAHKTLPLQTWVKVQNLNNNKEIVVRINDRGPFVKGRIIDLSYTGAKKLGIVEKGTAPVKVTVLGRLKDGNSKTKEYVPVNPYSGIFSIQVGAFQVRDNAEKLKFELSKTYPDVHIVTSEDARGTFYRVRIGRYSNIQHALSLEKELTTSRQMTVFLVAEE